MIRILSKHVDMVYFINLLHLLARGFAIFFVRFKHAYMQLNFITAKLNSFLAVLFQPNHPTNSTSSGMGRNILYSSSTCNPVYYCFLDIFHNNIYISMGGIE